MIQWYKKVVFENYANFRGRARRAEYWYFILANMIISFLLSSLDSILGLKYGSSNFGVLNGLYSLAVFVPTLAVSVRRLHDIGKSGKLLLLYYGILIISVVVMFVFGFTAIMAMLMSGSFDVTSLGVAFFVPLLVVLVISIWMLILFCTEGDQGSNKYGANPKDIFTEYNELDQLGKVESE